MESIPDRIYFKDLQSRFVRVNRAHAAWLGLASPEEAVGKTDFDFLTRVQAEASYASEQKIIRTGQPLLDWVELIVKQDGGEIWASITKVPWRDPAGCIIGICGLTRDITATRHTEVKLLEQRNLLRTIIDHLPSRIFVKDAQSRYVINNPAHLRELHVERQEDATGRTTLDFRPGVRGQQAMADDQRVLSGGPPVLSEERSDFGPEGNVHWALTTKMPLHDLHGRISGLVGISHDITERKLMEMELQRRTAEMEADVRMACQVQEVFMPRTYPVFPRDATAEASALRFAHRYVPSASLGGDFLTITQLSDTTCGVLVCDVMGHGVRAGLLTALIRGLVEELDTRAEDPAHVLAEINRGLIPILAQTGQPVFATAFFGVIDTSAGTLVYTNAGHPPPLVLRRSLGTVEPLISANPDPAAGLVEGFTYTRHTCGFHPGDLLLSYTDGLFEACNATGTLFGQERLQTFVARHSSLDGAQLIDRIVKEVAAFTGRQNFEDDICVVAIESTGHCRPTQSKALEI
ncbi:MAG: SpoIIE family protein phosphatase [Opitutaceae bacterium]|nr:SpoIIE family protein phosphatase [Opitutaceae bacterium]